MPTTHHVHLEGQVTPRGKLRVEQSSPSSSAVGGAIIGGAAAGSLLGPIGAIAGFVAGGIAGEVFERRAFRRDGGTSKGHETVERVNFEERIVERETADRAAAERRTVG